MKMSIVCLFRECARCEVCNAGGAGRYVDLGKQCEAAVKQGQEKIVDLHHENQRLRSFIANMQCKQV